MIQNDYKHRGQRVATMSPEKISSFASQIAVVMNIDESILKRMDLFIEDLWNEYGINVEIVSNNNWLHGVADAWCDPLLLTITIPEKLYIKIVTKKHRDSIFILFHEMGHLLLGHKAVLHHDESEELLFFENSEWQADHFAETIMTTIGGGKNKQLRLF